MVGESCVKDPDGNVAVDDTAKLKVWKTHYEKLLNVEFPWDSESLPDIEPVAGPPPSVSVEMIERALSKLKSGKAAGPSGIIAEMMRCDSPALKRAFADLATHIIGKGVIPEDWDLSYIINCYKGKGDALIWH